MPGAGYLEKCAKSTACLSAVLDPWAFLARDTIDKTDSEVIVRRGDYGEAR